MSSDKTLLVQLLRDRIVPSLMARGFQRSFSGRSQDSEEIGRAFPLGRFGRASGAHIDLLDIQIHKDRPAFVLNFGVAPPEGVSLPQGSFSQSELQVSGLLERCRLYSNRTFMIWFGPSRFSFGADSTSRLSGAVDRALELFPEVERYFGERTIGRHVKCIAYSRDAAGRERAAIRT